jgi:perosamine synthetase
VTERITRDSLILPLHHALTDDDQQYIADILRDLARP